MKNIKEALAAVLTVSLCLSAVACSNGNDTKESSDNSENKSTETVGESLTDAQSDSGDKTVITVTRWGEIEENDPEDIMIKKFNAENDQNIEIKYDVVPGDGYGDRLTTSFSSGEGYDVFASGEGDFYKWVDKSLAAPLDDLIANDSNWENKMDKSIFDMGNINGSQYYMVRDYNPICLWYNKDMFDEAGLDYPTNDWTWDDLEKAAQTLTTKDENGNFKTFGFNAQAWTYASLTYLESQGLNILSEDGKTVDNYLNSPEVAQALDKYVGWSSGDSRISPTASDLDTFGDTTAMFINKTVAMTLNGGWVKSELDNAKCNYGTALVPGNHNSYLCASAYALGSRCQNPEAAWEVIKLLTGEECTKLRTEYSAVLPTMSSQLDELKGSIDENSLGLIEQIDHSIQPVGMRSEVGNPAAQAFDEAFERMVYKDGTTEEILNDAVASVADKMNE